VQPVPGPAQPAPRKSSHLGLIIALIIIVALVAGAWWWSRSGVPMIEVTPQPSASPTPEFQEELDALDDIDVDAELRDIDAELNQL
jgi:hypothetical protein